MKLFNVWVSAEAAGTLKLDHDMNTSYSRKNWRKRKEEDFFVGDS